MKENIKRLIKERGLTQRELGKIIDVSQSTIASWLTGRGNPKYDSLVKMSRALGVPIEELLGQDAASDSRESPVSPVVKIPIYSTEASAGPGMWVDECQTESYLTINEDILRAELPGNPNRLVIVRVKGDSMRPTIEPGELVIIDKTERSITTDGIYALSIGNNLMVKRVQRLVDGINILSDNQLYPGQKITMADLESIAVSGRVVGIISMTKV